MVQGKFAEILESKLQGVLSHLRLHVASKNLLCLQADTSISQMALAGHHLFARRHGV
jgi:hypothetical protein